VEEIKMKVTQGTLPLLIICLILPVSQAVSHQLSDLNNLDAISRCEFKENVIRHAGSNWSGLSIVPISHNIAAQQLGAFGRTNSDTNVPRTERAAGYVQPYELMPDLVVTSISAPNEVYFEEPFTVSWIVYNQGDGNTVPIIWQDEVWLTGSEFEGESSIFLGSRQNKHALAPGESYTSSLQVSIEGGISPDCYYCLTVFTDAGHEVPECNEGNNAHCRLIEVQEHISYTITSSAGLNGSIRPTGAITVEPGDNQQFTAYSNFGYQVDTWYLDGGSVQTGGEIYVLEDIQANHRVYVTFKRLHGYSLNTIEFNTEQEFLSNIVHNNLTNLDDPQYSRQHVERVVGLTPDPDGLMIMRTLEDRDPKSETCGEIISARAKGLFRGTTANKLLVRFKYMFRNSAPGVVLMIYLSDVSQLLAHDDPQRLNHYVEIGRLFAPPPGWPGSVESGRFGVFEKKIPTELLDLSELTCIELELLQQGSALLAHSHRLRSTASNFASLAVDSFGPEVHCDGICLDITWDNFVNEVDFLTVISGCGCSAGLLSGGSGSLDCLEGPFSDDGRVDPYDVAGWDWTLNAEARKNLCEGVPISDESAMSTLSVSAIRGFPQPLVFNNLSAEPGDLLILGKRNSQKASEKLQDRIYIFDDTGQYVTWDSPSSNRCNIRLVRDPNGGLYQVNSETSVVTLNGSNEAIVPPGQVIFSEEPRYGKSATVYVGIQGEGSDAIGRPVFDVAINGGYAYVIPVVVDPDGEQAYLVAAKLRLLDSGNPPYEIVQLYDDPPPETDNQCRNALREIELDSAGNVYIINAHALNESDILWRYYPDGTCERLNLGIPDTNNCTADPIAMCMSNSTNMLYIGSAQYNQADANSTFVYGFSTDGNLSRERVITIDQMQHVTGITEDLASGCLWVVGFNLIDVPQYPNPILSPFYYPYLAKVPYDANQVQAEPISGSHDLALPMSIVWIGTIE
jgi:hypothetical protein